MLHRMHADLLAFSLHFFELSSCSTLSLFFPPTHRYSTGEEWPPIKTLYQALDISELGPSLGGMKPPLLTRRKRPSEKTCVKRLFWQTCIRLFRARSPLRPTPNTLLPLLSLWRTAPTPAPAARARPCGGRSGWSWAEGCTSSRCRSRCQSRARSRKSTS